MPETPTLGDTLSRGFWKQKPKEDKDDRPKGHALYDNKRSGYLGDSPEPGMRGDGKHKDGSDDAPKKE